MYRRKTPLRSMAKFRQKRLRRKPLLYMAAVCLLFVIITMVLMTFLHREKGYDDKQRSIWQRDQGPRLDIPDVEGRHLKGREHELPSLVIDSEVVVHPPKRSAVEMPPKTISFWNPTAHVVVQKLLQTDFAKCEFKCTMTANLNQSDAVIFWVDLLNKVHEPPSFHRKPGQRWVFRSIDAPSRFGYYSFLKTASYNKLFNWTMTYDKGSDIHTPFGRLVERLPSQKDYDKIYDGKTKSVAFMTNYCSVRSGRMKYVKRMRNKTNVDVLGICEKKECGTDGPIPWSKGLDSQICLPMLSKLYKFLLAFETSLCLDYVTDVFFDAYRNIDVIPVVRGGSQYKSMFPKNTFVDASDFNSPEALASFLETLGRNKTRYLEYLKAKDRYISAPDSPQWQCKLCQKLHTDKEHKSYPDIHAWWTRRACHDPGFDP